MRKSHKKNSHESRGKSLSKFDPSHKTPSGHKIPDVHKEPIKILQTLPR